MGGQSRSYDPLEYIRNTYGVPAFKNRVVKALGNFGVITGASGPHVAVRLSEAKHSRPYHPSDIDYLAEGQERRQSMSVRTSDRSTVFLYLLLRDYLPAGVIEKIMMDVENPKSAVCDLSNDLIANYAQEISGRLQNRFPDGDPIQLLEIRNRTPGRNEEGYKI